MKHIGYLVVAQWKECSPAKAEVAGSSPADETVEVPPTGTPYAFHGREAWTGLGR